MCKSTLILKNNQFVLTRQFLWRHSIDFVITVVTLSSYCLVFLGDRQSVWHVPHEKHPPSESLPAQSKQNHWNNVSILQKKLQSFRMLKCNHMYIFLHLDDLLRVLSTTLSLLSYDCLLAMLQHDCCMVSMLTCFFCIFLSEGRPV